LFKDSQAGSHASHADAYAATAIRLEAAPETAESLVQAIGLLRKSSSNRRAYGKHLLLNHVLRASTKTAYWALVQHKLAGEFGIAVMSDYPRLDQVYPDLAAWQVWVELKDVLAPRIDAVLAARK
jgi:hypothetical protein